MLQVIRTRILESTFVNAEEKTKFFDERFLKPIVALFGRTEKHRGVSSADSAFAFLEQLCCEPTLATRFYLDCASRHLIETYDFPLVMNAFQYPALYYLAWTLSAMRNNRILRFQYCAPTLLTVQGTVDLVLVVNQFLI